MIIRVYNLEDFYEIEPLWEQLEKGSDMTIFQSFLWYKWLNKAYIKERTKNLFRKIVYIVCLDENNNPLMIAPVQIVNHGKSFKGIGIEKGAYLVGRKKCTDYMSFIYDSFSSEAVEFIIDFIKTKYQVNSFFFEFVLENTEFSNYIRNKYGIQDPKEYDSAALYLPETYELYNKSLKKHAKQNFRTAINRQKRDEINLTHELVFSLSDDLYSQLIEIRSQRLKEKQRKSIKKFTSRIYNTAYGAINRMFSAKVNVFECSNSQWCFLVKHNEKIVGFYWGIFDKALKRYYVILAGVDKEYTWYSPSLSHLYLWIKEIYDNHIKNEFEIIDFTVGNERYKLDIGGSVTKIQQLFFEC